LVGDVINYMLTNKILYNTNFNINKPYCFKGYLQSWAKRVFIVLYNYAPFLYYSHIRCLSSKIEHT